MLPELGLETIETPFEKMGSYNVKKLCELLMSDGSDWFRDVTIKPNKSFWSIWCNKYQTRSLHLVLAATHSKSEARDFAHETFSSSLRKFRSEIRDQENITFFRCNEASTPADETFLLHDTLSEITNKPFKLCITQERTDRQTFLPLYYSQKLKFLDAEMPEWNDAIKTWNDNYDNLQKTVARLIMPNMFML